jgi:hypothetical protein
MAAAEPIQSTPTRPSRVIRTLATIILLSASIILLAWSTAYVTRHEPLDASSNAKPIGDPKDRVSRQHDALGTYATGNQPGDRVIIVRPDGTVRFHPVGPFEGSLAFSDTYSMGMIGDHPCLVTKRSGTIESTDIDHVSYFGDTYQRTK